MHLNQTKSLSMKTRNQQTHSNRNAQNDVLRDFLFLLPSCRKSSLLLYIFRGIFHGLYFPIEKIDTR